MNSKLKKSLKECKTTCALSLRALSSNAKNDEPPVTPLPPGLGEAVAGLLVNLRQTTTALGLAFKPPISVDAAIQQLDKTSDHIGKLISCVLLAHGYLAEEWRNGVEGIGGEIVRHIDVLSSSGSTEASGSKGDEYLASTGMVWESIDRLANGLSKDQRSAVVRKYKGQQGTVKDAWEEFKGILEEQEDDVKGEDEAEDDGWDELDLGGEALSEDERKRAEAAKSLLALHQILHATIPRFIDQFHDAIDIDTENASFPSGRHTYTELMQTSTAFVDAYDEAVSSMHPGQDEEDIEECLSELEAVSLKLAEMVDDKSIGKWRERLQVEKKKWDERRLDLSSLGDALG
ncbi:hypothetical protein IAT40_003036 [Kwoniella sp. CBS 6097]